MAEKAFANVTVRLPDAVLAQLEAKRAPLKVRSVAAVVQRLLEPRLMDGKLPSSYRRQPKSPKRTSLFMDRDFVERVRGIAEKTDTPVCDVLFTLVEEATAEMTRQQSAQAIEARAA